MSRFLKISAIVALVFFILLIAASFIVKRYYPSERIKALVISKAEEATGRKVSVGDIDISIFSGIDLRDIYVGENQIYGDIPFIKVKRVTVGYSFSELFRKRIVLDKVHIDQPEVYIRSRDGRLALPDLIKRPPPEEKPKKPLPFAVLLKSGTVKGIALFYEAEDARASVKGLDVLLDGDLYPFKGVNVNLSSKGPENIWVSAKGVTLNSDLISDLILRLRDVNSFSVRGNVGLKGLKAGIKDKTFNPFDVVAGIDLIGDISGGADIKGFSLAVGQGNTFIITGNIKELKGLKGLDMKLTGASDLGEVSRIAERLLPFPVTGTLKIGGLKVTGDLPDSLRFMTELSLKDVQGTYKGIQLPVSGFIKAEGDSKGHISMPEIKLSSGDALKVDAAVNASAWGKGRVNGTARIVADNEKILKMLPKGIMGKMGKVGLSGKTSVDVAAVRDSEKGPLMVKVSGNSAMTRLQAGPLSVQESAVTLSVVSDNILNGKTLINAGAKGKGLKFRKGDISFSEESLNISISASSKNLFKGDSTVKGTVVAKGLRLNKGDINLYEETADGLISVSGDFKKGNLLIDRSEMRVPELLKASFSGALKGWGRGLDLKGRVEEINFKNLMDKVPESIKQRLPKMEVEGSGVLSAAVSRGISRNGEDAENLITISGNFKTKGIGVSVPEKGLRIKDSEGDIDFDLSKKVQRISGAVKVGALGKSGLLEDPVGISSGFELLADGPDIKIKNLSASIPQKAISVSISGKVSEYVNAPRPDLDVAFSFKSPEKIDLLKGVDARGGVSFKGGVVSDKEKELFLRGGMKFDHLISSYRDKASVNDLNGEIMFVQGIRYAKGLELITERREKGQDAPYAGSLYDLMRPYVKKGYGVTVVSLSFDGYDAGPLSMDIAWDNGNLLINRYDLALLDGGATGKIQASYNNGVPEYSIYSNVAGVRFDKVFKDKKGRDLEINADLNLKGRGTDIEGDVNVTRIGKDLLDRGLLRLDPNESNPQIVDIRRKVNSLGWVPKEVSLWIRHGELNMDITLQRKRFTLLNIVSLEKIPVRRVPVDYIIKKGLRKTTD